MRRILPFVCLLSACLARPQLQEGQPFPLMPPKRWAIVIGAGKYETLGELRYAPADARDFAKALIDDFKFKPESVTKLIDDPNETPPTVANIRAKLDETLKDPRLNKGDLFIFYFSGHGVGTPMGDFLCPTDAKKDNIAEVGLPIKEVVERIVKAGLRNVLVITDACRGGEKNTFGDELNKLSKDANIGVMLGCQPGRRSYQNARGGHGYFTEHLLEALENPELRQKGTGALWASELGKEVSKGVEEATSRKEDIPQVPAIECDDRRDVMVGAFLPANFDQSTLDTLRNSKVEAGTERQASALADYGSRLFDAGRNEQAAEVMRVVDGMAELAPNDRLILVGALICSGRTNEASSGLKKLQESPDRFTAQLAYLLDPKGQDNLARLKAAEAVFEEFPKASMACCLSQMIGQPGDSPLRGKLLQKFLSKTSDLKDQTRLFLEAHVAYDAGDFSTAELKFRKSLATFGFQIEPNAIRWQLMLVLISQQKFAEVAKLCEDAIQQKAGDEGGWYCSRALIKRDHLDDNAGALADVKAALDFDLSPERMLTCIVAAGSGAKEFADRLVECGKRYPKSVPALIAATIGQGLADGHIPFSLPPDHPAFRYSETRPQVVLDYERTLSSLWKDLQSANAIPDEVYAEMIDARAYAMLSEIRSAGDDEAYWFWSTAACLRARRAPQLFIHYRNAWTKPLAEGKMSAEMQSNYMTAALAAGEFDTFDALYKKRIALGSDAADLPWLYALSLIERGRDEEAGKVIAANGESSPAYRDIANTLRLFAKTLKMSRADAIQTLEKAPKPELLVSNVLMAIAWIRLDKLDKADPLMANVGSVDNWIFQGVDVAAMSRFSAALQKRGMVDSADSILFLLVFQFPWMPACSALHFGAKEAVSEYVGELQFTGRARKDDRTVAAAKIDLTVLATGAAKGHLDDLEFKGTVDSRGNLRGTAIRKGESWQVSAKLAPLSYYQKFEPLKQENQIFTLLAADGRRIVYGVKLGS